MVDNKICNDLRVIVDILKTVSDEDVSQNLNFMLSDRLSTEIYVEILHTGDEVYSVDFISSNYRISVYLKDSGMNDICSIEYGRDVTSNHVLNISKSLEDIKNDLKNKYGEKYVLESL